MDELLPGGLAVRGLECTRAGRVVFAGLSFDAAAGDVVQVRGANGSGKSSLLRLLAGLLPPSAGGVHWRHRRVAAADAEFGREVAFLGHASGMSGELTVLENLRFALQLADAAAGEADCHAVLSRLRLAPQAQTLVRRLSQGQRRRLGLARVMLCRRALWLLDEPCAGLDGEGEAVFAGALAEHAAGGGTAVLAVHGPGPGEAPCTRVIDMDTLSDGHGSPAPHRA